MIKELNKTPLEADEQKALVQWLKLEKIDFFAPMNENMFSFLNRDVAMKIQAKAKTMGAKKGVSDLVIFLQNRIIFMELKRRKGSRTSKEQLKFLGSVSEYNYAESCIVYGWEEAKSMIEYYRSLK